VGKLYVHWKDVPKDAWRWPNFSPEEIASNVFKDGKKVKGPIMIDERALDMLQELRQILNKPFIINSAYRDPEYNKAIGGAKSSQHMLGTAFDISMSNHNPAEFEEAAIKVGFRGIGHYPGSNFMHIDARHSGNTVRWYGTGSNAKWFPKETKSNFSGNEPKKETVIDVIQKPAVLAPIGVAGGTILTAAVPASQGSGPFQWGLGIALVVLVLAGCIFLYKKFNVSNREI
jgi:zinc D-Ala-D-Ala carboxypeptidase